jgi:acetyl esterase/lipase
VSPLTKRSFLAAGVAGLSAMAAACSTLRLFNTFTPKDPGVRRVARNVAYGPGPRQTYDVYAPDGARDLPLIVFFYGGGWNSGAKEDYGWFAIALAAMGYVVAVPDYRVVPEVVYPVFLDDSAAAVKVIASRAITYGADSKRLGLAGHSAGAYNAVMLALDPRYLGADAAGNSPVLACVGVSGPYDFYPFNVKASRDAFGQWLRPEETQPITYARKTNTKFLLLQSRTDTIVGVHNAVNLDHKLEAAGTACTLKLYDGLTHQDTAAAFSVPFRGKGTLYADTQAFLKQALG